MCDKSDVCDRVMCKWDRVMCESDVCDSDVCVMSDVWDRVVCVIE